jgi:predicted PurR-regulated permease PerM
MDQHSQKHTSQAIEIFLRLSILVLLLYWCFQILSPFLLPVLWGLIIAVATYPAQKYWQPKLGNNQKLTAVLLTVIMLAVILVPVSLFVSSLTDSILLFKDQIATGAFVIPTPSETIKTWPVIGNKLYDFLIMLTQHTEEVFHQYQPEITSIGKSLLNAIVGTGLGILQLLLSVIIAGVLLATKGTEEAAHLVLNRLIENQGEEFVQLSATTIRNVVKGVLGVAIIQSILAGIGLYFSGIPHAGIWVLVCLIFAIIQIGPGVVLIPSIIYLFGTTDTLTAILWSIYFVVVLFSDNILKPVLLGKGAPVPMLVIFLGVIGGFMLFGFIGLFTGAIVLSVGYKLFLAWLHSKPA